jgi:hypothetical protein
MELEQMQVLNEVVHNENIGEFSLDNESVCDSDYIQLVTPGTHMIVESESDYISEGQQESINVRLGGVSSKFVWKCVDSYPPSREIFCDAYGPQLDIAEMSVMRAFENILNTTHYR